LTVSVALAVSSAVAVLAWPYVLQRRLLADLDSEDPSIRQLAIDRAAAWASEQPATRRALADALHDASDRQFYAIATALIRAGAGREVLEVPLRIDRLVTIELAVGQDGAEPNVPAPGRAQRVRRIILTGRANRHIRRALELAATDPAPDVRELAAVLATRLGETDLLALLADDCEPTVVSAALLDAAWTRTTRLADRAAELLDPADQPAVTVAAALALARLDPNAAADAIPDAYRSADSDATRNRLAWAAGWLPPHRAAAVLGDLRRHTPPGPATPYGLLSARPAGPAAKTLAEAILADAASAAPSVRLSQLIAAGEVLAESDLPRQALRQACGTMLSHWAAGRAQRAMIPLVQAVGRALQPIYHPAEPNLPVEVHCLHLGARYHQPPGTDPNRSWPLHTPLASAAAVEWLWRLGHPQAGRLARQLAGAETTLAGDAVAWRLGRLGDPNAFALGLEMLPPPHDRSPTQPPNRVYNDNERAAGAMLLALSADTDAQRALARRRIVGRLDGGLYGGEDNPLVRGAYQCALLIAGDESRRPAVRTLLRSIDFPQRRAMTALLVTGDRDALDWLLTNPAVSDWSVAHLLLDRGIAEVLADTHPQLPLPWPAAEKDLLFHQIRWLRHAYLLSFDNLEHRP
jgi:hypothetical protein